MTDDQLELLREFTENPYARPKLADAIAAAVAEIEILKAHLGVSGNMLRYISFVLVGDETADAQLAADKAVTEIDGVRTALCVQPGTSTVDAARAAVGQAQLLADSCQAGMEEIEKLRAIVAKLPLTADGVPVTPGMELWESPSSYAPERGPRRWSGNVGMFNGNLADYFKGVYGTREAAEAAKEAKP